MIAKAILATPRADGVFQVAGVYPIGTDLKTVANPPAGSMLIRVFRLSDGAYSVGDTVSTDDLCNGAVQAVAASTTLNWTQWKQAYNAES